MISKAVAVVCCSILSFSSTTAVADTYRLPAQGESVIGKIQYVKSRYEDTFSDIARRYNLGYNELVLANPGVDPWMPGEGTTILLPTLYVLPNAPRRGVVLNVPEMRLYYYPEAPVDGTPVVITYPVSVGRVEWDTPLGLTKVVKKQANPTWYPPASIRKEYAERGDILPRSVPPGPDNPLGEYSIRLAIPGYLLHGTNQPYGVGMRVTHGCVRLYPEDIAVLFHDITLDTEVNIVNQPYKAGWREGNLYVEAHPHLEEDLPKVGSSRTAVVKAVVRADDRDNANIAWEEVLEVAESENGVPAIVSINEENTLVIADTHSK